MSLLQVAVTGPWYTPTRPLRDVPGRLSGVGTTPEELADELHVSAKEIRRYLRAEHPRSEAEKHDRWNVNDRTADAARQHFRSR